MDIKLNISTATITSDQLETLIKESVKKSYGREVASVVFNVSQRQHGYGVGEYTSPQLDGVTIHFAKD